MTAVLMSLCILWPSTGCDLAHREQRRYCARANTEECRQRPEWCIALGGNDVCTEPDGQASLYCAPAADGRRCELQPESLDQHCPESSRWVRQGIVQDLTSHSSLALTQAARALAQKKLGETDVDRLSADERRLLCDKPPGDACALGYDAARQLAACAVAADACAHSRIAREPAQCIAKNLCDSVICL